MDFNGKICPVCSVEFKEDDDIVVCPKCGAPYHRECYKAKGKCIFPTLHKEGKSWKSVYDKKTESDEKEDSRSRDNTVCKNCGHKNSPDSIVCERCGEFLTGQVSDTVHYDDQEQEENEIEKIKEQMKNVTPIMGSANFYSNAGSPFTYGFGENEDYDGVSTKELADYIGPNALYYIPIFSRIKNFNTSRFNFAAFLFNGAWYFYRKQYLKGIFISVIMLALNILQGFATIYWSGSLWEKANIALGAAEHMPTYQEYFSWISENCTTQEMLLMALPYVLSMLSFVAMIVCGLLANKGYYKKALKSVRRIKDENIDDDSEKLRKTIVRKGGVHLGAAFVLITCESILSLAIMYFFS